MLEGEQRNNIDFMGMQLMRLIGRKFSKAVSNVINKKNRKTLIRTKILTFKKHLRSEGISTHVREYIKYIKS